MTVYKKDNLDGLSDKSIRPAPGMFPGRRNQAGQQRPLHMDTYKGVVYPAQTDAMGHMTVQYYVAAFDQAMWHLVAALGYNPDWRHERKEGWADVRHEINYHDEIRVGDLFSVRSEVRKVGKSSLVTHHRLMNTSNKLCAEIEMTSVYFDLEKRVSKALPEALRNTAQDWLSRQSTMN
ncbi:acyl-CoA thioesterase [Pseudomonas sp. ZM23]|uniref:Acyl-CoA thioesterase n=1 Tax=Pseudomonas triclosanedens TaxID=2961893 RepID=A0ABY7A5F7_9PSED|nr:acyl-CoA thioesterase [Pseudomonas triclosanedens]MCP8465062.1 acyl-CoA thioesterase [Pseudomonas triclosanedens]MCP8470226.1 acyl-CoA thioesterase [Pseudomonas triclosanedens]MCP8476031.1 acyl-CoA thioesterase [Pseudomonas triclosanedens]WAI51731.1 acyl-CoA thioesterase [Pseudomonas triclosanedens]